MFTTAGRDAFSGRENWCSSHSMPAATRPRLVRIVSDSMTEAT